MGEDVLEHAGSGAGSGNELALARDLRGVRVLGRFLELLLVKPYDSAAHFGGGNDVQ